MNYYEVDLAKVERKRRIDGTAWCIKAKRKPSRADICNLLRKRMREEGMNKVMYIERLSEKDAKTYFDKAIIIS